MKTDLQTITIKSGQDVRMRLPELVAGINGTVSVVADEDALPGSRAVIKLSLDIEVVPEGSS